MLQQCFTNQAEQCHIVVGFQFGCASMPGWTILPEQLLYRLMQGMGRAESHPCVKVLHAPLVEAAAGRSLLWDIMYRKVANAQLLRSWAI